MKGPIRVIDEAFMRVAMVTDKQNGKSPNLAFALLLPLARNIRWRRHHQEGRSIAMLQPPS